MESNTENNAAGFSLPEALGLLRRRRGIIGQAFVLITVIGAAQALMAKNVYQATAKMLVEGPSYNLNTVDSGNPLASLFQMSQQQTVDTQVEVLQAAPLLDQVAKEIGPAGLSVANVKDTNVVAVTGESSDPKIAAAAPNALLRLYIAQDAGSSLNEIETARRFVITQGALARTRLTATENALKRFKQQTHLAELTKNRDDQIGIVSALTADQQKLQTDLASLRAQIAADQREMAQTPAMTVTKSQATNAALANLNDAVRTLEVQRIGMIQPGGLTPQAPADQGPRRPDRRASAAPGGPAGAGPERERQPQRLSPGASGEDRRPPSADPRDRDAANDQQCQSRESDRQSRRLRGPGTDLRPSHPRT